MKFLDNLIKKPTKFQRMLGLSIEQFKKLAKILEELWETMKKENDTGKERIRKIGAGRPYMLGTIEEKFFILLFMYKQYVTQEVLASIAEIDQSTVSRLLSRMHGLIEQAADPELASYMHKAKQEYEKLKEENRLQDWDKFLKKHPDFEETITDAEEQRCLRPQDHEKQKAYYSGKKKHHSLKV